MTKHTLLTREEALRAREIIRERLGSDRHLKITAAALFAKSQQDGAFVGYASTFDGEADLAGDVVARGAFAQSIKDWEARGVWPPLLWNHDISNPAASLGVITGMREDERGLLVTGQLDLMHEPAVAVWKAMKSGRITTFSFAYAVLSEHRRQDGVNILDQLDCLEVSVTPAPANRNAQLVSIKTQPEPEPAAELVAAIVARKEKNNRTMFGTSPDLKEYYADLNARIDAPVQRAEVDPGAVDRLVTEVKLERAREKLAEARASSFDAEMNERAANTGPVPEFDERFAITSVPTEYESGDPEPDQVVGYESETFRIAVVPGTMRPNNE